MGGPTFDLCLNRFDSYFSQIDTRRLIVSGKKFHIRRKSIFWFKGKFIQEEKKISFGEYIYKKLINYPNLILKSIPLIFSYINAITFFYVFSNTKDLTSFSFFRKSILYYYNFVLNTHSITSNLLKNGKINYGFIVYTYPNKQLFVNLFSQRNSIIITAGLIRRSLDLDKKSSKKYSNVVNATIKFSAIFASESSSELPLILKLRRNVNLAHKIISNLSRYNLTNNIQYILYEPKLQFDSLNISRRADIKKRLRKKKKYIGD